MTKIKIQTSWNLPKVFGFLSPKDIEKRQQKTEEANEAFVQKWRKRNDYLESAEVLLEALGDYEKLHRLYGSDGGVGYYYSMKAEEDESDSQTRASYNAVSDWSTKLQNELQFFELALAKIPKDHQMLFLKSGLLKDYTHFLERIFTFGAHTLSDPEERILNLKSGTSYEQWTKMTSSLLSKEEAEVLDHAGKRAMKTFEEIRNLMSNGKKKVRDTAFASYSRILSKWIPVGEAELNAVLEDKRINDELRGYNNPVSSRFLHDDIDPKMVNALIEAVTENISISHDYFKLKAKLLGVKKIYYHERLVDIGSVDRQYSFGEAYALVKGVFEKLDPLFSETMESFFANGQVDVFPKKGKRGGAFCAHNLKEHPTVVLLNHTGKLRDVITIAHEFGHAINNVLVEKNQNALSARTPTSTAEVASTFMEDFVFEEIEKSLQAKERIGLLMNKLSEDILSVFYCVAMYRFEQELHETYRAKRYLSSKEISAIYRKYMQWWTGPAVIMQEGAQHSWLAVPHVRYFFYMYSYASGVLISKALQQGVRKDSKYIEKVKAFLSAGTSQSPKDIFGNLGVDITKKRFWLQGIQQIATLLSEAKTLAK